MKFNLNLIEPTLLKMMSKPKFLNYFFVIILMNFVQTQAQFMIVEDPDGFVNLRQQPNNKSQIITKINDNQIVYKFINDSNDTWLQVNYSNENQEEFMGYIHESRLKEFHEFEKLEVLSKDEQTIEFSNQKIRLIINIAPFDFKTNQDKFSIRKLDDLTIYENYNGKQVWGTDGEIPKDQFQSIEIYTNDKKYLIAKEQVENYFNPHFEFAQAYYDHQSEKIYYLSTNSDGAGAYELLLIFEQGQFIHSKAIIPF